MSEQIRHDYTPSSDLDGSPCAICGDRPGDDHYEFAAQPAPGRWHWWVTPDIIYPCCCTDGKHLYAAPEPDYLNALEAERDEAVKHYELLHASFDSLMAERNALREQLADALTDLGWSSDKVQTALDAALQEGR